MKAFLDDSSPDAFAKVVDRLLASPRYGERWGRHWLDVARYADSNGLDENLVYKNAFRYRDYVIQAFNQDKPFDQFLTEQLAGDLLPTNDLKTQIERWTATGFLTLGAKMLAEDDPVKMEMDIVDEQLDTTVRAFMGLTIGCARCHGTGYRGRLAVFEAASGPADAPLPFAPGSLGAEGLACVLQQRSTFEEVLLHCPHPAWAAQGVDAGRGGGVR